jgi:RNA polymerase sigma-70 factor (ECF subfamily)
VPQELEDADDTTLVAALRQGDEAAMSEILRRHRPAVMGFARRLVGDGRAEEVAQEVFLRLWQRADRFDAGRGTLRAFLLALTHGRALDVARADAARSRREARQAHHRVPTSDEIEPVVEARTVADAVRRALAALPDAEREVVELAYFGGHSYRAVATMLGLPEGTVKGRIRAGLMKLRTALDEYGRAS